MSRKLLRAHTRAAYRETLRGLAMYKRTLVTWIRRAHTPQRPHPAPARNRLLGVLCLLTCQVTSLYTSLDHKSAQASGSPVASQSDTGPRALEPGNPIE